MYAREGISERSLYYSKCALRTRQAYPCTSKVQAKEERKAVQFGISSIPTTSANVTI
jgi:hypothetical protein